jgi:DegV family protein with EDD domain
MNRVALVTDSTACLGANTAGAHGIDIVAAGFAFADERYSDGALSAAELCARIDAAGVSPRAFGVTETAFRDAFEAALTRGDAVCCIVTPFGGSPTFTTAAAAVLEIQANTSSAVLKVANAGIGAAGLGALLVSLSCLTQSRASLDDVLQRMDDLQPRCESFAVPATNQWLERSGSAAAIRDRLGPLDGGFPVLRVGTRITGVSSAKTHGEAIANAIASAGARAGSSRLNIVVGHANAPELAQEIVDRMCATWPVEGALVGELSATHIAELGPGAIAIGVCPVPEVA